MRKFAAIALAASTFASAAQAQQTSSPPPNTLYAGAGLSFVNIDADPLDGTATALRGKVGYVFIPFLSVEAHLGLGLTEAEDTLLGNDYDLSLDTWYGIYARGQYTLAPQLTIYGLAGFTQGTFEASGPGIDDSEDESDFSWGFGADYQFSERFGAHADWMMLINKDDGEASAFTLGAHYIF